MNFGEPFGGLIPGARGAVLYRLLRTGAALTGRQVHSQVRDTHSLGSVQQALRELEQLGLTTSEPVGRAHVHQINEQHETVGHLRALMSPLDILTTVVHDVSSGAQAVIVFGSVARGEGTSQSDVDLAVIAPDDWDGRVELADAVHDRLGNSCDVLHLGPDDFTDTRDEPVVADILRDGIALLGKVPRHRATSRS